MRTFATSVNDNNIFAIHQDELVYDFKAVISRLTVEFDRVHETTATRNGIGVFSPAEREAWDLLIHFLLEAKEAKAKALPNSFDSTLPVNTGHVSMCLNTGAVFLVLINEERDYGEERRAGYAND